MTWKVDRVQARRFRRNPLKQVICQVAFQPILKIQKDAGIEDFQDQIRERFPKYSAEKVRTVRINGADPNDVEFSDSSIHRFLRKNDESALQLATDSLTVDYKLHSNHDPVVEDIESALKALTTVYGKIVIKRLGLRYINVIDKDAVAKDLGKTLAWSDVVNEEFLSVPHSMVGLDETKYLTEITAPFNSGLLTLKYGLLADKALDGKKSFRFDIDRYESGELKMDEIGTKIREFVHDTFSVFSLLMTDNLSDWMEPTSNDGAKQ